MATQNPFENEKPQIVHFEKDDSHYEYCRNQMREIERMLRRTFICNVVLCVIVCFLSIFQKYIGGFDLLSTPLGLTDVRAAGAILAGGIFQIIIAMIVIVLGYLAWANFHTLNIILEAFYVIVTCIGVVRLDYLSALIGIVGTVFYFFAIREMRKEQALSEMEGYPDFPERLDISKSDIVIQTLLAHQGERRTKSTLFTTDYSLRKKKKQPSYYKNGNSIGNRAEEKEEGAAGEALAKVLKQQLSDVQDARHTRTAIASLEAVAAEQKREKDGVSLKDMAELLDAPLEAETADAAAPKTEKSDAQANIHPERADAEAAAAAILAEAEEKAKAILAAAEAQAKALAQQNPAEAPDEASAAEARTEQPEAQPAAASEESPERESAEQPEAKPAEAASPQQPRPAQGGQGNPNRKKKKKKH